MLLRNKPIGTAAYLGGVPAVLEEFCHSWSQMIQLNQEILCQPGEYVHLDRSISSYHSSARNSLAQQMLGDWLFMTDCDHAFEPDLLLRMVTVLNQAKIDVLTGVYRYRVHPYLPVIYKWNEEAGGFSVLATMDWEAPLQEIDCSGAGCLLVRRSVFQRIWSELGENPFDILHPLSEDFSFFKRLKKLGIKAYCAPQIESQHLKIKRITSADADLTGLSLQKVETITRGI